MQAHVQHQLDNLTQDLRWGSPSQRRWAATKLREHGEVAVSPLCLALHDKDFNVRSAAAESLGHIGDERAVRHLIDALRDAFAGRSPWLHVAAGLLLLLGFFLLGGVVFLIIVGLYLLLAIVLGGSGVLEVLAWSSLVGFFDGVVDFFNFRRRRNQFCRIVAEALAGIAEKSPTPELRSVIADLKAIAADKLQQEPLTRNAAYQAAQRIEALTEQLKSLPLPASAPAPNAATLPRTADAPMPKTETLPRVQG